MSTRNGATTQFIDGEVEGGGLRVSTVGTESDPTDRGLTAARRGDLPTIGLGDVGRVFLQRWRSIVVGVVLMTLLAGVAHSLLPPAYTATTRLVVSPLVSDPSAGASARDSVNIATEREIVQSAAVANMALEQVGRPPSDTEDLIANLNVVAPNNSFVLRITVTDTSAEGAAALANAVADSYLEFRQAGGQEVVVRLTENIDDRIAELTEQPSDELDRQEIRALNDQRQTLALFGQNPGRVIGQATPPTSPSGPGLTVFLLAGVAGGVILGGVLALLRERTDRRVRTASRLEKFAELQSTVLAGPTDQESLRWLRRSIVALVPSGGTVLLLSASPTGVGMAEPLALVTRDAGFEVDVENANALTPAEIDDWRFGRRVPSVTQAGEMRPRQSPTALQLIDATNVTSRTSISELADRADVAVFIVTPKDRLAMVREIRDVTLGAAQQFLVVFVQGTTKVSKGKA